MHLLLEVGIHLEPSHSNQLFPTRHPTEHRLTVSKAACTDLPSLDRRSDVPPKARVSLDTGDRCGGGDNPPRSSSDGDDVPELIGTIASGASASRYMNNASITMDISHLPSTSHTR
eukprot:m.1058047 g.1058047  ORF g.1058047 m.1058047 type:complete len:116 (-) comp24205_c0_seq61:3442-3789(-)